MKRLTKFGLKRGDLLADKYEVLAKIGSGWEGEVYRVKELSIGVQRAAKLFFPHRDKRGQSLKFTARKLHKLRACHVLVKYHNQEKLEWGDHQVNMLVSELVEGQVLEKFVKSQPSRRMSYCEALRLLHALAKGVAKIHAMKEYHGDIHENNVIVARRGIMFDVGIIDVYNHGKANANQIQEDVVELIKLFHFMIGGKKAYSKHPKYIKEIICGLRMDLIKKKYKNATQLVSYLQNFKWE